MKRKNSDWYKNGWSLNIMNHSWTEETKKQVDFLITTLGLKGGERILDLACGFGRHSLELARRGFEVVGVDITKDYIVHAEKQAKAEGLSASFLNADIRELNFNSEFNVVLNMADGAIGYLENDMENLKVFDVISRALVCGGKHFMDIMSADYADGHFPCNLWDMGKCGVTLSKFEWDKESKIMLYGQNDFSYGNVLTKPVFEFGDPIRLYHLAEIEKIMADRKMKITNLFSNFDRAQLDKNSIQMLVCSQKL